MKRQGFPILIASFLAAALISILAAAFFPLKGLGSVLYGMILIAWIQSVERRILSRRMRRLLIWCGFILLFLFFCRICRYDFFSWSVVLSRYLWYGYYLAFVLAPLFTFLAACCVGRDETEKPGKERLLWIPALVFLIGALTNDLHGLMFVIRSGFEDGEYKYSYGPLYYAYFAWCVLLTAAALIIVLRRCSLSESRKRFYVPSLTVLVTLILIVVYMICGGSPKVHGVCLYYIQEVYTFLYVGLWEACIRIGLIHSNTGYNTLFSHSHVRAAVRNRDWEIVYRSLGEQDTDSGDAPDFIRKKRAIEAGTIEWTEDHREIHRLNRKLADLAVELEEENELIREENRVREERTRLEAQNRLYNTISADLQVTLDRLAAVVPDEESGKAMSEETLRGRMLAAAILGAYIKRRANLVILADRDKNLSAAELVLALRESLEQLSTAGFVTELRGSAADATALPVAPVLFAYDLFEAVAEEIALGAGEDGAETLVPRAATISVSVRQTPDFVLTIQTDTEKGLPDPDRMTVRAEKAGAALRVLEEDGETTVEMRYGGGAV